MVASQATAFLDILMHERKNEDILSFVTGVVERRYFIDKKQFLCLLTWEF
jgi:hypothetical protein